MAPITIRRYDVPGGREVAVSRPEEFQRKDVIPHNTGVGTGQSMTSLVYLGDYTQGKLFVGRFSKPDIAARIYADQNDILFERNGMTILHVRTIGLYSRNKDEEFDLIDPHLQEAGL